MKLLDLGGARIPRCFVANRVKPNRFTVDQRIRELSDRQRRRYLTTAFGALHRKLHHLHFHSDLVPAFLRLFRATATLSASYMRSLGRQYTLQRDIPDKKGRRRIPLAKELVKQLRLHRLRTPGPLVFPGPSGAPIDYHNWRARVWVPLLERTGAVEDQPERVAIDGTFHMLRHFFVTALIQSGVNMKVAQTLAGHHSAAFTLDQYADAVPQQLEEAGEKVASVLLAASGSILVAAPKIAASVPSQVFDFVARPDGFEPPTTWFEVKCSNRVGLILDLFFSSLQISLQIKPARSRGTATCD